MYWSEELLVGNQLMIIIKGSIVMSNKGNDILKWYSSIKN